MTLKSQLQNSNPFKPERCNREMCFVCTTSGVGNCNTENVTYEITCKQDGCTKNNVYKGETADNAYTRGHKHLTDLNGRNKNSPLWRHCREVHNGQIQTFSMKITGTYRNDSMLRQITEAVQIDNTDKNALMNTRAEWNRTRVPRATVSNE